MNKPQLRKRMVAGSVIAGLLLTSILIWSATSLSSSEQTSTADTKKLTERDSSMNPKEVTIRVGQQGKEWVDMYPNAVHVNDKNANGEIVFYKVDWPDQGPFGTVSIDHGVNSFNVPYVMGVMGSALPSDHPDEGIDEFDLSVSLTPSPTESHPEALHQFYALLKTIQNVGWKREIRVFNPRLSGRDALLYSQTEDGDGYSIDASYVPTLIEWMKIEDIGSHWRFYANNVYLDVTFMRDHDKMDTNQPGAYLVSLNFKNSNSVERAYFKEKDRPRYKQLYPAERKRLAKLRGEAERKISSQYHIDETYIDPDGETLAPGWIRQGEIN
ncbi:hypothetical protein [Glaciimonas soli]|uniref:Uncharacterized protein n=1 Tax=Glaciimonas soli TaxID=2590999 RepID=A0A843Z1P9_9BURK|nr:hypothetical protein [Glaciimonas soli]MQR02786.1 hypothetical protein [Glaciimonas soli]